MGAHSSVRLGGKFRYSISVASGEVGKKLLGELVNAPLINVRCGLCAPEGIHLAAKDFPRVYMVAACFAELGLARGSSMLVCARAWLVLAVLAGARKGGREGGGIFVSKI